MTLPTDTRLERQWSELDALVRRARKRGARRLSEDELTRLDRLYRLATIHLAQARSRTRDAHLIAELNRLVASAHSIIYAPTRKGAARSVLGFLASGFPRAVAEGGRFHWLAGVLLIAGAVMGWFVADTEPDGAYLLMPGGDIRVPGASVEQLESVLRSGRTMAAEEKSFFAAFLFTHNTKVGFSAFATGILGGVPTVFMMIFNGALLGAFAHVHASKGITVEMWSWLLPHGVTELLAIVLCGGAGLSVGAAVVAPGNRPRTMALMEAGRRAVLVMLGVILMLFVAGLIESFLRQSNLSIGARLAFAGGSAVFWTTYFTHGAALLRQARGDSAREF